MTTKDTATAARAIWCVAEDCLNDLGNGEYTATVGACSLTRDGQPPTTHGDGSTNESQEGDVLSVQPDGSLQTRAAGTDGWYERAKKLSSWLVYRTQNGQPYIVALVSDWPNR